MRQLFFTPSKQALATWLEAFPEADIMPLECMEVAGAEQQICWLRVVPGLDVAQGIVALKKHVVGAFVVMSDLPSDEEASFVLSQGAAGYCNSNAAPEVLHQIANVVENGGLWIGQQLMQQFIASMAKLSGGKPAPAVCVRDQLSEREWEVAKLVASGASNKEIARELVISERTVKAHLGAIFEKTHCRDRLQLSLKVNGVLE